MIPQGYIIGSHDAAEAIELEKQEREKDLEPPPKEIDLIALRNVIMKAHEQAIDVVVNLDAVLKELEGVK